MDMQANTTVATVDDGFAMRLVPARICVVCKATKPMDEATFAAKKKSRRGVVEEWDDTCNVCRELQACQRDEKIRPGMLKMFMDEIIKGKNTPQAHDLLNCLYKEFHGPEGVARDAKRVFDRAMGKGDYKTPARIIDMVTRLQMKVTGLQQERDIKEMDRETLDDHIATLETQLAARLIEMQQQSDGKFIQEDGNA